MATLTLTQRLLNRDPQEAWDPYDDMPLDRNYVAPVGLKNCTPNK